MLRLVVPDYISPSYFPAIAAHQLGYLADEGLDVDLALRFPVTEAATAMRDGAVDFIAGAAHAPMYAFPGWRGASVLMALSRHMYWFLVVRADLGIGRGELARIAGLRIGAAPGPDDGLRALLDEAGVPAGAVAIQPVPGSSEHGTSFGLAAAAALRSGAIDGFWANGMGAEVAIRRGDGNVVYDARRDTDYPLAPLVTFPALTTRTEFADSAPEAVARMVRGIRRAQRDLAADPGLAAKVGAAVFPAYEASLIGSLIERDAPYYQAPVTLEMAEGVARLGRLSGHAVPAAPGDIVRGDLAPLWDLCGSDMSYPYTDLREYLAALGKRGLLTTVADPVNKDTELVPLVRLQFRGLPQEQRRGFHFTNVTDSRGRAFGGSVAIATFAASREIYDLAVGAGRAAGETQPAAAGEAWARALEHPIEPRLVETGPCKENVITGDALDPAGVDAFPHPVSTPGFDPAPFLTAGCWVSRDAEDGTYNVGTYRGMIKGPRKIGLQMDTPSQHIAIHLAKARRAGRKLEVAIVVGVVPAVALSSVQKLPYGFSEYALAGGLMGRPLEVVKAETVDIDVPAHAEIVIEGHIDPEDLEPEGPFGEASGYMGPRTMSPYVHVTAITHRTAPVVQAFISEYPPSESTMMRKIGFENVYTRFLRQSCNIASVTKVTFYESASVNMIITVSLANPTAGQAWQAMYAVAGYEPSMGKIIIAVDDDIDPENLDSIWWALSYRLQPHRDTRVLEGRVARLDPSAPNVAGQPAPAASSLLIDATRGRPYPPTSLPSQERMAAAQARWAELGLPPLALHAPWFGTEFGAWDSGNRAQARRAEAGDYLG